MAGKVFNFGKTSVLFSKHGVAMRLGDKKYRIVYATMLDPIKNAFTRQPSKNLADSDEQGHSDRGYYDPNAPVYADDGQKNYEQSGAYDPQYDPYAVQMDQNGGYAPADGDAEDPYSPVDYQQKWYEKEWVIWLLLIVFPPLGIFLLWKLRYYLINYRVWLTAGSGLWAVVLLFLLFGGGGDPLTPVIQYTTPPLEVVETLAPTFTPAPTVAPVVDGTDTGFDNPIKTVDTTTVAAPPTGGVAQTELVWATGKGAYFHLKSNCSGMTGAKQENVMTAIARGLQACPVCVLKTTAKLPTGGATPAPARMTATPRPTATPKVTRTPKPTATPKRTATPRPTATPKGGTVIRLSATPRGSATPRVSPTPKPTSLRLYATKDGQYYHANATCGGMKNAKALSPKQAKALSPAKAPCPVCKPPALSAL